MATCSLDEFPLPDGAVLIHDSVWTVDTMHVEVIDTIKQVTRPEFTVDYDTYTVDTVEAEWVTAWEQDFEDPENNQEPFSDGFWSDGGFYEGGWESVFSGGDEAYTGWNALWLPGENGWTGPYGESPPMVVDNTKQRITFMYKGKVWMWLTFGDYVGYDLVADPDGIVPPEANVDGGTLDWSLDSDEWTEFSFEWDQGSWQADSALADTVPLYFTIGHGYVPGVNGFIDDMKYQRWTVVDPARIDTNYAVTSEIITDYWVDEMVRIDFEIVKKYSHSWQHGTTASDILDEYKVHAEHKIEKLEQQSLTPVKELNGIIEQCKETDGRIWWAAHAGLAGPRYLPAGPVTVVETGVAGPAHPLKNAPPTDSTISLLIKELPTAPRHG